MERIVFYNERDGELIEGLLNPETMTWQRQAGLRERSLDGLPLNAATQTDDALIYTGGGVTTAELDLLFDLRVMQGSSVEGSATGPQDVREITRKFWDLAESRPDGEDVWPPQLRLIWGNWSVPVVVTAVAERLEDFAQSGMPSRSWVKLGLRRVAERAELELAPERPPLTGDAVREAISQLGADDIAVESAPFSNAERTDWLFRLDLLAQRSFGDPRSWRFLAEINDLEDPLRPTAGEPLVTIMRDGGRSE